MTVRPSGVCIVDGADAQWSRSDSVARQSAKMHVLECRRQVVCCRRALNASLQTVGTEGVVVVAPSRWWLEESPQLESGPVANSPKSGRRRWRGRQLLSGGAGDAHQEADDRERQESRIAADQSALQREPSLQYRLRSVLRFAFPRARIGYIGGDPVLPQHTQSTRKITGMKRVERLPPCRFQYRDRAGKAKLIRGHESRPAPARDTTETGPGSRSSGNGRVPS